MISVVTITFNNFDELRATVESIQHLKKDIEFIVVNGGSCQQTRQYLLNLQREWESACGPSTHQPVKLLQEADRGIADAFNKGVRLATGRGIVFLNSGDRLLQKEYFQVADAILSSHPEIDFVHSDVLFADALCGDMIMAPRQCSLGRGMPYYHQTMVVRREVFEQVGPFLLQYKIGMDFDFVVKMHKLKKRGHYHRSEPVIHMDGAGVSATREGLSLRECYLSLRNNHMLTLENLWGLGLRYTFYGLRRIIVAMGMAGVLQKLKRRKNERIRRQYENLSP